MSFACKSLNRPWPRYHRRYASCRDIDATGTVARAYSGVGLHIRRDAFLDEPRFLHPTFDYETRIVAAQMGDLSFVSVYVPNGGKDFPAKMQFLGEMERYVAEIHASGGRLVLCGDINIARTERDVHPKERNPRARGAAAGGEADARAHLGARSRRCWARAGPR